MKRTFTLADDLVEELELYLARQNKNLSLEDVLIAALREYLQLEALRASKNQPSNKSFGPQPLLEKDDQGEKDVSLNCDEGFDKP